MRADPRPRPSIFSVPPYVGGESAIGGVNRVIKLSSNEGAFGPPPGAIGAMREAAGSAYRYPDGASTSLRRAIGKAFDLDPARIVCGNGSDDLIGLLIQSYGGAGTELVMSAHGFLIYEIAAKLAGMVVRKATERNLTADIDAMLAQVTPATRMVFLANPNNPTGSLVPAAVVRRLRDALPGDVLLVLDAAYAEYVDRADYDPGIELVDAGHNTVMTRTFSKMFGLGGVRLGWAYAPEAVVDVLNRTRMPFNVSSLAAAAGIAALTEAGWVEKCRSHNRQARATLREKLVRAGLTVHPSDANFVLVDLATAARATLADEHLRQRGIIVRNVAAYDLPQCLRVTIGTDEQCDAVAAALTAFVALHG
ncbi:MAG: histidinol-phosphate transaminase [Acidiphilium sp. 37-64-53]|uniref:histidinol-phosphate transaminase n=1 Tax=Acidiphilium TaxID=522 RepID=UPI000BD0ECBD|nr:MULTISPECIES: histidinol-phosphate transaminase [Acidiphilium]OYW04019.1 MAG: histidinol-phosphate transaminase [Acidiphilium sp. 37-64-53]OZB29055.1 MAG: histidinol-phosphate transaminase [Acidiphilium sp. 34-64-41]HQT83247.1 histidinol-phosphate transaminase [Acidiphilium rubrum]